MVNYAWFLQSSDVLCNFVSLNTSTILVSRPIRPFSLAMMWSLFKDLFEIFQGIEQFYLIGKFS